MVLLIFFSKSFFFFIRFIVVLVVCFIILFVKIILFISCLENIVKNLFAFFVDMDRVNFFDWFFF